MGKYTTVAEAQADGCIHYWDFNETSGTTFADQVGGLNGVVSNTGAGDNSASIVDGELGKARDLAALGWDQTDQLTLKAQPSLFGFDPNTTHTSYSLRARVYFRSVYDLLSGATIFRNKGTGTSGYLNLYIWEDKLEVYSENAYYQHTTTLTANAWFEAFVTYDGTELKLYLNGSEIYSVTSNNDLNLYRGNYWHFGCDDGASNDYLTKLDGLIDEFAVWNRALSALEISTLYNGGTATPLIEPAPPPVLTPLTNPPAAATYKAVLTGSPDSTSDLELRISSFSARLRDAAESYLQIVVPNARNVADEIEARPNGELVIYQTTGGIDVELARSNFGDMRIDDGPRSGHTVTLSGHKYTTFNTADGHEIQKTTYYSKSNGKSRIRCPIIAGVEPGDTINAFGVQFIAGAVFLNGAANLAYMEVGEA